MIRKSSATAEVRPRLHRLGHPRPQPLALAILAVLTTPGYATSFDINEDWSLSTKTTLTLGSSWSTQNPDKSLMTRANALQAQGVRANGTSVSADDNRLNFEKGDPISQNFKGLTDFSLDGQGQGAFIRFKYWYDHAYETRNGRFKDFDDSGWDDLSKFKGFEMLDAYVWKDFQVAEHPLNVKVGNQVLSWGESLLIQNGINVINPLDVSAFNRPGVEIKEGQLPVEMVSFSFGLSDTTNLEGFYQYNWRPSVLDGCGTFFASSDAIQKGCGPLYLEPGADRSTDAGRRVVRHVPWQRIAVRQRPVRLRLAPDDPRAERCRSGDLLHQLSLAAAVLHPRREEHQPARHVPRWYSGAELRGGVSGKHSPVWHQPQWCRTEQRHLPGR